MIRTFIFTTALLASCAALAAPPVNIGRAVVYFPDHGTWEQIDQENGEIKTRGTGISDGALKNETKTFALTLPNKQWGAVFVITASKYGSLATMSWNGGCKPYGKEKTVDFTKGSFNLANCAHIWDNIDTISLFNDKAYDKAKQHYLSKAVPLKGGAYSVTHFYGSNSGTYLDIDVLISEHMLTWLKSLHKDDTITALEAWARLLAAASASSADSLSGRLEIPALD